MLHKGQWFTLGGQTFKVEYVNPSRAHCIARVPKTVVINGRRGTRTFTAHRRITLDIAPNSGVAVLMELEQAR